jgi:hypothetical protein
MSEVTLEQTVAAFLTLRRADIEEPTGLLASWHAANGENGFYLIRIGKARLCFSEGEKFLQWKLTFTDQQVNIEVVEYSDKSLATQTLGIEKFEQHYEKVLAAMREKFSPITLD